MNYIKTKSLKIIVLLLVAALSAALFAGCVLRKSDRYRAAAEQYISAKYGSNFTIVGYVAEQQSASGMRPARVEVVQNGITYTVEVQGGQVVSDNYSEKKAEAIALETIDENLKKNGKYPLYTNRDVYYNCDVAVTDPGLLQIDVDLSNAKTYSDIEQIADAAGGIATAYINVAVKDSADYRTEAWLYDYYLACQEEFECYELSIQVFEINNPTTYHRMSVGGPEPKGATLTVIEFWGMFGEAYY